MPDDKKQGSIHSSSEGGTAGVYPAPVPSEFLVAPSTSTESNNINLNLFLTAYMCISDIRFKFDSSFVLPTVQAEMQAFSSLRKQNPQVLGSPISIFGHADPSFQGNFEVGSKYAKSGDDYNKTLSGRRAVAIYALLIRDPSFWNTLYTNHLGGDVWGEDSIRIMLDALGQGGSSGSGGSSQNSSDSAKKSRVHDIANDSGQRQQLFVQYMSFLCGDLKLDKSADFLARNAGSDQKGDVQGCSRFNPLMLFSSEDEARFKQAFADKDEATLRGERDPQNAVNRRVMILIFKKGSQVLPAKWPCPSYKDGTAGCIKRFWSDGDTRRSTHNSGAERKFELSTDTFACRFYQRISGDKSPCNSTSPPVKKRKVTMIKVKLPTTQSVRGTGSIAPPLDDHEFSSTSNSKDLAANAPVVLVRNCADLALEAVTDPPNQADVVWSVDPNPGGTAAPVLNSLDAKATLKTDAEGGYVVSATLDGTTIYWNLVLVNVTVQSSALLKSRLNFTDDSGAGTVGAKSGQFSIANPAICAMYIKAVVQLSAGGQASLDTYLDKVHVGFPQNLRNDSAHAIYEAGRQERERVVIPPKPHSPIVDPSIVVHDLGYPILDRGGRPASIRATGGNTIFLASTKSTPDNGKNRTVETCDSPGVGFHDPHREFGKPVTKKATGIAGVNAFRLYLAAYSDDANFSYVAFGEADWTADFTGTISRASGAATWAATSADVTGATSLTLIPNGKEAKAAGCEVRTPVFLDYILDAR